VKNIIYEIFYIEKKEVNLYRDGFLFNILSFSQNLFNPRIEEGNEKLKTRNKKHILKIRKYFLFHFIVLPVLLCVYPCAPVVLFLSCFADKSFLNLTKLACLNAPDWNRSNPFISTTLPRYFLGFKVSSTLTENGI